MPNNLLCACRRENYVQAAYVDAALTLLHTTHSHRLISILRTQGIPENVIARVFGTAGPFRRRVAK